MRLTGELFERWDQTPVRLPAEREERILSFFVGCSRSESTQSDNPSLSMIHAKLRSITGGMVRKQRIVNDI